MNWSSSSLGILGSAADLAAIAAFFNFVLLIGIDAPGGHAMPRTQSSGQAHVLGASRIGSKAANALANVSRNGRSELAISETIHAGEVAASFLPHVGQVLAAPDSKVHRVRISGSGDCGRHEADLAAAFRKPGNPARDVDVGKVTVQGDELLSAACDPNNRIERLWMEESHADPARLARTLESPGNH